MRNSNVTNKQQEDTEKKKKNVMTLFKRINNTPRVR